MTPIAAIAAIFFAFGLGMGLWAGASASILIGAHVTAADFGVALTLYTAAYLVAMAAGGALAQRFGLRRVIILPALAMGVALAALLNARSAPFVYGALIALAFGAGLLDLTMNAEGARIERHLGRPILARFHAMASSGMAIGAIGGSLIAASLGNRFSGLVAFAGLALAAAAFAYVREPDAPAPAVRPASARGFSFTFAIILIGVILGVCIAAETAAQLWSSLLLRLEAPSLAAISGLGAAFFSGCEAIVRFNADVLRARFTDGRIIAGSLAIAAAGFACVGADGGFGPSVFGFALIGFGAAAVVPCGFALAAGTPGLTPAAGLASANLFSTVARLPAPLATGAIASAVSLPAAFAGFALLLALAAALFALYGSARSAETQGAPKPVGDLVP
jgi:hypothetical protein